MLYFKRVDPKCAEDIESLLRWDNDKVLSETLRPNFYNEPLPAVTCDEVYAAQTDASRVCFLFGETEKENVRPDKWLGYVQIQFSHPVMMGERAHAGWLAICIGEPEGRRKGYGRIAMEFIEDFARSYGLDRLELGVFEFNAPARKLYESCGYKEIGRNAGFAWHNGRKFSDIRMEKRI